jgi:hypothetical protein
MFVLALIGSVALAGEPLVIEGVDDLNDVPTVTPRVDRVDFTEGLDVSGTLHRPSIEVVWAPDPHWNGNFIRLRQSFDPEISRSLRSLP